jgi:hypothetical protein
MEFRKIDPWAPQRIPLASKTSTRKWSEELPEFSNRKPGNLAGKNRKYIFRKNGKSGGKKSGKNILQKPGNLAGKIRKNIFRETGKSGGKKPGKTSLDFRDLY